MDADCLIKLAKAGLKELVANKDSVSIPEAVKREVVDAGKKKQCLDAFVVEKNIESKMIAVIDLPTQVEKGDQALNYVSQLEKIEKTQSLRKLARIGFEYYVAKSYKEGRITLRDASDLLKLSLSETIDLSD